MLCMDQSKETNIYLEGMRDDEVNKINSAFLELKVDVCQNSTLTQDQQKRGVRCATKE